MPDDKKRITFEDAKALYPDEWVVFSEPRMDMENTTFMDGVVHFHGKDHEEALKKSQEIDGDAAVEFTGERSYEKVIWQDDSSAQDKPADKAT